MKPKTCDASKGVNMTKTKITATEARGVLDYCQSMGVVTWRVACGRQAAGSVAGSMDSKGYLRIGVLGERHRLHRIAWLLAYGEWPSGLIDHINGVKTDNRLSNLRDTTKSVNAQNMKAERSGTKSGLLGAHAGRYGTWGAYIKLSGRTTYLGSFKCKEEAHAAYLAAKSVLHEASAR